MSRKPSAKSPPSLAVFDPEWWKIALALFVIFLLQTTLLPRLAFRGGVVSPALLLVLWYGINAGALRGAFFGMLVGACEDGLGVGGAAWTIADAVVGALAGALGRTQLTTSALGASFAAIPLTAVRYVVFLFVFHGEHGAFTEAHWGAMLWQSLLNAGATFVALVIVARYDLSYAGR